MAAAPLPPLCGGRAFEALFRNGRRFEGRYLQCVVQPATAQGRVGFVFSRKQMPRAVDRNRLRRQIREMLRATRVTFDHCDLIVRARRRLGAAELAAAAAEARTLLASIAARPAA